MGKKEEKKRISIGAIDNVLGNAPGIFKLIDIAAQLNAPGDDELPIVKRVIAIGGDTVKITKKAIFVNGTELIEDYVYIDDAGGDYCYSVYPTEALLSIVTGFKDGEYFEITVPENEIFVMGDHRNDSTDSRKIGTLHEDAIIGKVVLRFYPFENFGKVE